MPHAHACARPRAATLRHVASAVLLDAAEDDARTRPAVGGDARARLDAAVRRTAARVPRRGAFGSAVAAGAIAATATPDGTCAPACWDAAVADLAAAARGAGLDALPAPLGRAAAARLADHDGVWGAAAGSGPDGPVSRAATGRSRTMLTVRVPAAPYRGR